MAHRDLPAGKGSSRRRRSRVDGFYRRSGPPVVTPVYKAKPVPTFGHGPESVEMTGKLFFTRSLRFRNGCPGNAKVHYRLEDTDNAKTHTMHFCIVCVSQRISQMGARPSQTVLFPLPDDGGLIGFQQSGGLVAAGVPL